MTNNTVKANTTTKFLILILSMEAELDVEALRANLRTDGRQKNAMRELHMEKGSTYRADGSGTVSHGTLELNAYNRKETRQW